MGERHRQDDQRHGSHRRVGGMPPARVGPEPVHGRGQAGASRKPTLSLAKKAAAFFSRSRSMRRVRFSRRRRLSSSSSSVVRPLVRPASTSCWRAHRRSDSWAMPSSSAILFKPRPDERYRRTASARNSGVYRECVLGKWTPFPGMIYPSVQVSTKPGQPHLKAWVASTTSTGRPSPRSTTSP